MDKKQAVSFEAPADYFPSEPIFVASDNPTSEDDGIVLVGGFRSSTKKGKTKKQDVSLDSQLCCEGVG